MQVKDINFKEYAELKDRSKYDFYLKWGVFEAEDVFALGPFLDLSFGTVKDIQYDVSLSLTWEKFFKALSELKDLSYKELAERSVFQLHKARLYFVEQIELINSMESEYLGHAANADEKNAGIEMFSSYGAFIQFDKLAGGNPLKYDEVKKLKYDLCFTKLKLEADRNEFNERYADIIKNKKP